MCRFDIESLLIKASSCHNLPSRPPSTLTPLAQRKGKQTSKHPPEFGSVSLQFNMPTRAAIHLMCFISIERTRSWWVVGEAAYFSIIKSIFAEWEKLFALRPKLSLWVLSIPLMFIMPEWITKFPFSSSFVHETESRRNKNVSLSIFIAGPTRNKIKKYSFIQTHFRWD